MSEFEIEIFPNPTNGILHIGIPNNRSSVFTLYDSKGQEVMHRHLAQSLNSFDLSDLRKGLYSVMLKFDNKAFKRLIVIQ
jgi:hypothetical protein